jgi:hypothetical protein
MEFAPLQIADQLKEMDAAFFAGSVLDRKAG